MSYLLWLRPFLCVLISIQLTIPQAAYANVMSGMSSFFAAMMIGNVNPALENIDTSLIHAQIDSNAREKVELQQLDSQESENSGSKRDILENIRTFINGIPDPVKNYLFLTTLIVSISGLMEKFGPKYVKKIFPFITESEMDDLVVSLKLLRTSLLVTLTVQQFQFLQAVLPVLNIAANAAGTYFLYQFGRHPIVAWLVNSLKEQRTRYGYKKVQQLANLNVHTMAQLEMFQKGADSKQVANWFKEYMERMTAHEQSIDEESLDIARNIGNTIAGTLALVIFSIPTGLLNRVVNAFAFASVFGYIMSNNFPSFMRHINCKRLMNDGLQRFWKSV